MHVIEKSKLINGNWSNERKKNHWLEIFDFSLRQEIHDLRQKLELQSTESDENQNTLRRRFQDTVSDLTSQVEALSKGKARLSWIWSVSLNEHLF